MFLDSILELRSYFWIRHHVFLHWKIYARIRSNFFQKWRRNIIDYCSDKESMKDIHSTMTRVKYCFYEVDSIYNLLICNEVQAFFWGKAHMNSIQIKKKYSNSYSSHQKPLMYPANFKYLQTTITIYSCTFMKKISGLPVTQSGTNHDTIQMCFKSLLSRLVQWNQQSSKEDWFFHRTAEVQLKHSSQPQF